MGLHLAALFLPIFISPLFVFSSEINQIGSNQHLVNDLEAAKLRISQLGKKQKNTSFLLVSPDRLFVCLVFGN